MVSGDVAIRRFVVRELRRCRDLSKVTHRVVRERYLEYVNLESLSEQDADLLNRIVEEELLIMQHRDSSENEPLIKKTVPRSSQNYKRKREEKEEDGLKDEVVRKKKSRREKMHPEAQDSRIEREKQENVVDHDEERGKGEALESCTESEEEKKPSTKMAGKKSKRRLPKHCSEEVETGLEDLVKKSRQKNTRPKETKNNVDSGESSNQASDEEVEKKQNVRRQPKKPEVEFDSEQEDDDKKDAERNRVGLTVGDTGSSSESEKEAKRSVQKRRELIRKGNAWAKQSMGNSDSDEEGNIKENGEEGSKMRDAGNGKQDSYEEELNKREEEGEEEKNGSRHDSDSSSLPSLEDEEEGKNKAEPEKTKRNKREKGSSSKGRQDEENRSVTRLKRYISLCGVRRNYKKLFEGCRSVKSKVTVLKKELEELGVVGLPSIEKCKRARFKREEAQELAELDVSNIIATEGRPKRRAACVWPPSQTLSPLAPQYKRALNSDSEEDSSGSGGHKRGTDWSNLRGIISDGDDSD